MPDPRQIGYYRIESRLGSGRYTDTYRAVDTVRKRTVALKVLKTGLLPGEQALSRFLQQAQCASDLVHPHLAWIWEVGETDGFAYLAERYVNGHSLAQILVESGALPWEQALQMTHHIAQGLDFAHARDWVHGGVQPRNILISPDLGAVLTDFGLAKALQASGMPANVPLYTAPEVWRGQPASSASDQYALACAWAEALTGKPLFEASTPDEIRAKHLAGLEGIPDGSLERPMIDPAQVPWYALKAFKRALSQDPARRFSNLSEFAEAPEGFAAEAGEDRDERARHEAEARAWREAAEQSRRQAEEAQRLAALEQARREIDEQLRREAAERNQEKATEQPVSLQPLAPTPPQPAAPAVKTAPRQPVTRRKTGRLGTRWLWPIWAAAILLIIALGGWWLDSQFSHTSFFPATITSSPLPPTATLTLTPTHTPTITPTSTPTSTLTLSPTPTLSGTPTLTFTPSLTPTITQTPPRTPTRTSTPRDSSSREPPNWRRTPAP